MSKSLDNKWQKDVKILKKLDHLNRNDFILQKQENEKRRLEAETQALIAMKEQGEAEKKAKSELSKIESDTDKQRQELFSPALCR